MKNIERHMKELYNNPLSVIVRTNSELNAWKVIDSCVNNGFHFVEVTLTVPNALQIIKEARQKYPNIIFGAGTVLTLQEAKNAINNGAQYLVSPVYSKEILIWSLENDILYTPGVMTVNEMFEAFTNGANLMKFYPATSVSPQTLKLIASPFPNFKLLATGGIDIENINDYFAAGVFAVGITGKLGGATDEDTQADIANLAKLFVNKIEHIKKERAQNNEY